MILLLTVFIKIKKNLEKRRKKKKKERKRKKKKGDYCIYPQETGS